MQGKEGMSFDVSLSVFLSRDNGILKSIKTRLTNESFLLLLILIRLVSRNFSVKVTERKIKIKFLKIYQEK